MILSPKKIKFKSKFKQRSFLGIKNEFLFFGNFGFFFKKILFLNAKKIFKFKLFFKKLNKKSDKTKRKLWFRTFPYFPLSKKPQGLRMGKGKGKLQLWYAKIRPGLILIQVKNIRKGRVFFFFKQFEYKLNRKLCIVYSNYLNNKFLKGKFYFY